MQPIEADARMLAVPAPPAECSGVAQWQAGGVHRCELDPRHVRALPDARPESEAAVVTHDEFEARPMHGVQLGALVLCWAFVFGFMAGAMSMVWWLR